MRVENMYGIRNARMAIVKGKKVVITHRDPKSGDLWADNYIVGPGILGWWFPSSEVRFID